MPSEPYCVWCEGTSISEGSGGVEKRTRLGMGAGDVCDPGDKDGRERSPDVRNLMLGWANFDVSGGKVRGFKSPHFGNSEKEAEGEERCEIIEGCARGGGASKTQATEC